MNFLGLEKLIKDKSSTLEIKFVTTFMELLQALQIQTILVWVYYPQRLSRLAPHTARHIFQLSHQRMTHLIETEKKREHEWEGGK